MDLRDRQLLFRRVNDALRLVVVIQIREELVVLFLRQWIELVVVALGAGDGEAEERLADGVHPVVHGIHAELFRIDSSFLVQHGIAKKSGGDDLVLGRVWQQVAGDLLADELVVGQIAVECVDDIVAIEPNLPRHVLLVAVGVGIAGRIEPGPRPALAVVRRAKQTLDDLLVGVWRFVRDEFIDLLDGRRQADEIEIRAAARA